MAIGPAEVLTLLLGAAFLALLVATVLLLLFWVIRRGTAAGIRDARADEQPLREHER